MKNPKKYRISGLHWAENPIYVFQEMKLAGLISNSYIHVHLSDLYIPGILLPIWLPKIGSPILGIYKSLTDTGKWKLGDRTL
jgi:hypothetical protein